MERKDRITVSGQNKLNETLNKLLLNNTDIAKQLLMKRVNEVAARMSMITLRPGQKLNLEEPSMYIVLDGALRIATNDQHLNDLENLRKNTSRP